MLEVNFIQIQYLLQNLLKEQELTQSPFIYEKIERHINDNDAKKIAIKNLLVNLEISTNKKIVKQALRIRPDFICIVPENRKEITTEGGLNLKKTKQILRQLFLILRKKK